MKLLLTADLHFRLHWFRWLIEQAPDFDLVCIAGDLLDMLKSETRIEQSGEIARLIRGMVNRTWGAPERACSCRVFYLVTPHRASFSKFR